MKIYFLALLILFSNLSLAIDDTAVKNEILGNYKQGKYAKTLEQLSKWEIDLTLRGEVPNEILGFVAYWKGICHKKLLDYRLSINELNRALKYNFEPQDLHYELGQNFYAMEEYDAARDEFSQSFKKKFKQAVSLYYIGYVSNELGQKDEALFFLKSIRKVKDPEKKDVLQPTEMLIAEISQSQIKEIKRDDAKVLVKLYKRAYRFDDSSDLAPKILENITKLEKDFQLRLFEYSNGRPTAPPFIILKANQEFGEDSNVTFSPAGTTIAKARQGSIYSRTDLFYKDTFYLGKSLGISPEFRFANTYYFNRVPEIYRNDNYLLIPGVKLNQEHKLFDRPASLLLDYDYSDARRDVYSKHAYSMSSKTHAFSIGEKLQLIEAGETVIRLRKRFLESYLVGSSSKSTGVSIEQLINLKDKYLFIYLGYDQMRVSNSVYDTDALTLRNDFTFSAIKNFVPALSLGLGLTDPINNRSTRGREYLINPGARMSYRFNKHWNFTMRYDYHNYHSKDDANFAYKKFHLCI